MSPPATSQETDESLMLACSAGDATLFALHIVLPMPTGNADRVPLEALRATAPTP